MIALVREGDPSALAVSAYLLLLAASWLANHRDNLRRRNRWRRR